MGTEWLNEIISLLSAAQIPAQDGFPGGVWMEITGPVAAVGLRNLEWKTGMGEFEVRILSPRRLGGRMCQDAAAKALTVLETAGAGCRLEPMRYLDGSDCFEMVLIGQWIVVEQEEPEEPELPEEPEQLRYLDVSVGGTQMAWVTECSAEQDRQRRLIGQIREGEPAGITPPCGGWRIRLVQQVPTEETAQAEPEEPFTLTIRETGVTTVFSGCAWNKVKKKILPEQTRMEWDGFALTREETAVG